MVLNPDLTNCTYYSITDTITLTGPSSFLPIIASIALEVLDSFILQFYLNLSFGMGNGYNSTLYIVVGADS
jgi:hypothetical protein